MPDRDPPSRPHTPNPPKRKMREIHVPHLTNRSPYQFAAGDSFPRRGPWWRATERRSVRWCWPACGCPGRAGRPARRGRAVRRSIGSSFREGVERTLPLGARSSRGRRDLVGNGESEKSPARGPSRYRARHLDDRRRWERPELRRTPSRVSFCRALAAPRRSAPRVDSLTAPRIRKRTVSGVRMRDVCEAVAPAFVRANEPRDQRLADSGGPQ